MTGTLLERGASRDPARGHTSVLSTAAGRARGALVGAYIGLQGHVEGHAWIEGTADTGLRPEGAAAILHSHPPFTSRHGILNEYTRIPYSAHPPMQPIRIMQITDQ